MNKLKNFRYISVILHFIWVDGGTETSVMAVTHKQLRSQDRHHVMDGVEFNPEDNVLFGPSTQNKIKRWDIIKSVLLSIPCVGNVDF